MYGTSIGVSKGDTRSLDYGSFGFFRLGGSSHRALHKTFSKVAPKNQCVFWVGGFSNPRLQVFRILLP